MKIALVSSCVPLVRGGYRHIVDWLEPHLQQAGHQVERIYLPEVDHPDTLFRQMMAFRWVDLDRADRIICFRPQAHLIPHPQKIVWFIHHLRVFYDLWDSPYRGFPDDARHRGLRDAIRQADTAALREARMVFSNSRVVSDRLQHFNGIASEVLYPPVYAPERFHGGDASDEILYVCRLEHHKRQHLLIEALPHTRTPVRLRLSGTGGSDYVQQLTARIAELGLAERVTLDNRWISEAEKVQQLAHCLATAYLPLDEDSYGYPSLEASHSEKAILTTRDAGGVLELVEHGYNGYIADPGPQALAEAMDTLYRDRARTRTLGRNAKARLTALNISWPHVLNRLLA